MSNELSAQDLLPPEIGLTLLGFEKSEQGWLVRADGRTRSSDCPSCGTQSTARHSRYWRQLQDRPVQGKPVALQLPLSRWRCRNAECKQAIFRERLGEVVLPWVRRTGRVEEVMILVSHRTGGRAGEYLLKRLAMAVRLAVLSCVAGRTTEWASSLRWNLPFIRIGKETALFIGLKNPWAASALVNSSNLFVHSGEVKVGAFDYPGGKLYDLFRRKALLRYQSADNISLTQSTAAACCMVIHSR